MRRKFRVIRIAGEFALFALLVLGGGCIQAGERTVLITLKDLKDPKRDMGKIVTTYYDLGSNGSTPQEREGDFMSLISAWKDDSYLAQQAAGKRYVKSRKLWIRGGHLLGREVAIFSTIDALKGVLHSDSSGYVAEVGFDDGEDLVTSNGSVVRGWDGALVRWPPETTVFEFRVRQAAVMTSFVGPFRKYLTQEVAKSPMAGH